MPLWRREARVRVAHPRYIVIPGPAEVRERPPSEQPDLPDWLGLDLGPPQQREFAIRLQHRRLDLGGEADVGVGEEVGV